MAKYERIFKGNVDFNGIETSYQEEFVKRVAAAGDTAEEMIDVLKDMNVIISKCMNDTIDAAKNGAKVNVPYMDSFRMQYRSGAVATKDYAAIKLLPGQLALAPLQLSIKGAGSIPAGRPENPFKRTIRKEKKGKKVVTVAEDLLTAVRNEAAVYAYQKIAENLKTSILGELQAYQTQDVRLHHSLKFLSEAYDSVMHIENGDKKAAKKAIVHMSRNLVRNYSPTSALLPETYLASKYIDKKTGAERTNSYYMAFTAEAVEYFVKHYNPDGEFENRVYKFGGGRARVGQKIRFENGISADGFYADTKVNGNFVLGIDNDINAVIRKPVKDMVPAATYDDSAVFLELLTGDATAKVVELIEKARAAKAPFTIRYINKITGRIQDSPLCANLYLLAGSTKIAELRMPRNQGGISHYENFLAGKQVSIGLIEILPPRKDKYTRTYVMGSII